MSDEGIEFEEFVDPVDGTRWQVDISFLGSRWRCIWGAGCQGILDEPAEALGQGCCSVGVAMSDEAEAMLVSALGAMIDPSRFQYAGQAEKGGVFRDDSRGYTALADGACIFLNRPGFEGGAGCALHLQAEADGEDPIDWKPSACWQLPLKVESLGTGSVLRRWERVDWGDGGDTMAWSCTEEPATQIGDSPVAVHLIKELTALVGPEVAVAIRDRVVSRPVPPR